MSSYLNLILEQCIVSHDSHLSKFDFWPKLNDFSVFDQVEIPIS